jgi:hypothetical protein
MHGLGRGRWKRAAFLILPARAILCRPVGIPSGTSLAAYFTKVTESHFVTNILDQAGASWYSFLSNIFMASEETAQVC